MTRSKIAIAAASARARVSCVYTRSGVLVWPSHALQVTSTANSSGAKKLDGEGEEGDDKKDAQLQGMSCINCQKKKTKCDRGVPCR